MKRKVFTLIGVVSLLLAAGSAFAQTIHVKANVPFDFAVSKEILARGTYEVTTMGQGRTLLIRDSEGKPQAMINSNRVESVNASGKTKLVFDRYGDRYFLREIWVAGANSGHQLPKSARETEAVAMHQSPDRVIVLAELR